jgi:hypothetical protein
MKTNRLVSLSKNSTVPFLFCAIALNLLSLNLLAQRDLKTILMGEVVKVEDGNYSIEEYGILSSFDKMYEVKITATAPVSLLSRDNFIRFYGAFSTSILATWFNQEGIRQPDDLHMALSATPGDPIDIEVTIAMNEKGVDYVVSSNGSKSKMQIQWRTQLYIDLE